MRNRKMSVGEKKRKKAAYNHMYWLKNHKSKIKPEPKKVVFQDGEMMPCRQEIKFCYGCRPYHDDCKAYKKACENGLAPKPWTSN